MAGFVAALLIPSSFHTKSVYTRGGSVLSVQITPIRCPLDFALHAADPLLSRMDIENSPRIVEMARVRALFPSFRVHN